MTRQEFLETLGRMLRRELSDGEVEDTLRYYGNYIEQEIQKGKTEEQVLETLGDPRLIARTILDVDQEREGEQEPAYSRAETVYTERADGSYGEADDAQEPYREVYGNPFDDAYGGFYGNAQEENPYGNGYDGYDESGPDVYGGGFHVHKFGFKGWLILILVLAIVFLVLGTLFTILWELLPVLLLIAAGMWIYRRFFS